MHAILMRVALLSLFWCGGASSLTMPATEVVRACQRAVSALSLPELASERAMGYVEELLRYNERTNVYSKSAYDKLPFHLADSLELAQIIAESSPRAVLDLGSGSGLPSLLIACVMPSTTVFAVESKSRCALSPPLLYLAAPPAKPREQGAPPAPAGRRAFLRTQRSSSGWTRTCHSRRTSTSSAARGPST